MVVVPAVEDRYKNFGTIAIPFITITLKADLLFIWLPLLLYKLLGKKSDLEWYTDSGVWKIWGGLGWASGLADPHSLRMTFTKGGVIHRDTYKEGNGGKIQAMGTYYHFIVRKFALLGVSDYCVKKTKRMPCPHEKIYFKVLWTVFHILHWIRKSYGIQITPLGRSRRHCPHCLQ